MNRFLPWMQLKCCWPGHRHRHHFHFEIWIILINLATTTTIVIIILWEIWHKKNNEKKVKSQHYGFISFYFSLFHRSKNFHSMCKCFAEFFFVFFDWSMTVQVNEFFLSVDFVHFFRCSVEMFWDFVFVLIIRFDSDFFPFLFFHNYYKQTNEQGLWIITKQNKTKKNLKWLQRSKCYYCTTNQWVTL